MGGKIEGRETNRMLKNKQRDKVLTLFYLSPTPERKYPYQKFLPPPLNTPLSPHHSSFS